MRRPIGEIMCYLPEKKTKFRFFFQTFATVQMVPQMCPGQAFGTVGSQFSKFHPNLFNFGGVIVERMKAVLLAHRVFAIFAGTYGE